jgi:chemotaxis protein methyltransferase CheR
MPDTGLVPAQANEREFEFPFTVKDFEQLAAIVYDRSGIVLGSHKKNMVYSRLVRRLRALKLKSFRDYCDVVQSEEGEEEMGVLINAITTNLTKFFREDHHFDHLRAVVLGDLADAAARGAHKRLRIWSAGCSSGEEPYSIAMTIASTLQNLPQWDVRLLATDLDTTMVAKAKSGFYSAEALAEAPGDLVKRFFEPQSNGGERGFAASDVLRRMITFKQLNLMSDWPMKGPFDAIFCRNVMIYFDGPTKANLIERYAGLLKPKGWLYVGHSESLLDQQALFKLCGRTIYQKVA